MAMSLQQSLQQIDIAAWAALATATDDANVGFRLLNLCSVDAAGRPQARTVVLRRVDPLARQLEFHTDIRSPKWLEIATNPQVTVLGYCPVSRLQLRLQGTAELCCPGSPAANKAWSQLSGHTQSTYSGGPPGEVPVSEPVSADIATAQCPATAGEKSHFGVIKISVSVLDWFLLQRQNNLRALLTYAEEGAVETAQWINP